MTFLHKLAQRLARLKVALLIGLLATLACERPVTAVLNTALRVASINVSPAAASVPVGRAMQLIATPRDSTGAPLTGRALTWLSSNLNVAAVDGGGLVTGQAPGAATIAAVSEGVTGTATLTVTNIPVASVTVTPVTASISPGQMWQLTASPKDANGNPLTGRVVTWASSATAIATVNVSGLVTGVTAGSATITATSEGQSGTAAVTVSVVPVASVTVSPAPASVPVGQTVQLTATPRDANNNPLLGRVVTWVSSNTLVATVNGSGLVIGVATGSATITATSEGVTGTAVITVTVTAPPPPPPGGTLLQEGFDNANLAARGWYDGNPATISATEYHTGGGSLEARFLAGATNPSWGTFRHLFTPSPTLYVSFWVKYSTNWIGSGKLYHPHEFMILSDLDGDWDGLSNDYLTAYIEQVYQNGGVPHLALQDNKSINLGYGTPPTNLVGVTENRSVSGCNGIAEFAGVDAWSCFNGPPWYNNKEFHAADVAFQPNPGPGYKANWNHVEAYFQMNSMVGGVGQTDGILRYWFNGVLVIERTNVLFRTGAHATLQFKQIVVAPYIGDGSPVDQTVWYDELTVATNKP